MDTTTDIRCAIEVDRMKQEPGSSRYAQAAGTLRATDYVLTVKEFSYSFPKTTGLMHWRQFAVQVFSSEGWAESLILCWTRRFDAAIAQTSLDDFSVSNSNGSASQTQVPS